MNFDKVKTFGLSIAIWNFLFRHKSKFRLFSQYIIDQKHSTIKRKLISELDLLNVEYSSISNTKNSIDKVWYFWWDGIDAMPDVCKRCFDSITAHCHDVNIVDKNNYKTFVTLNATIEQKFVEGKIPIQQFADILRIELIKMNGGIWLDATIFLSSGIDSELQKSFFTVKHGHASEFVSNGKWSIFCIGAKPNHPLFSFLSVAFERYFQKYDLLVDYFLMDYFVSIAYDTVCNVRKEIDDLQVNNPDIYFLQKNLNNEFDKETWERVETGTKIFKLNWRVKRNPSINGNSTVSKVINVKK